MDNWFIYNALAILSMLMIWSIAYLLSKKIKIPYTVILVVFWIFLIPLSKFELFHFITEFNLTDEILFLVFLPVLIFESWYNMWYRDILKNWKSISLLAVFWLLISAFSIWFWLFWIFKLIWFDIPIEICLLFWSIISATDTVSVLALFKELWAPKRLVMIFEWESIFNDWTSLALFFVMIEVITHWINIWTLWEWVLTFLSMILLWIFFWIFMWVLFSKFIEKVKWNENIEVIFTMVVAYMTFILSEIISENLILFWFEIKISWVIATALAAIVIWNYWKNKISYKVQDYMEKFWSFVAFVVNCFVFILMWIMFFKLNIDFKDFILPIIISIFIVIVSRSLSVFIPIWILNMTKFEERIPYSWQMILAWWSLRWVLSMMMVLMIPDNFTISWWNYSFSIKEFLLSITIWTILFTLLIKSSSISYFAKKLWINNLYEEEIYEQKETNILLKIEILDKIENLFEKWQINKTEYDSLKKIYLKKLNNAIQSMKGYLSKKWEKSEQFLKKVISLHILWAEKYFLKELFRYNEIDEYIYKYMIHKIEKRFEILNKWQEWITLKWTTFEIKLIDKLLNFLHSRKDNIIYKYIKYRTKFLISNKIIFELKQLRDIDFWFEKKIFDDLICQYNKIWEINKDKMNELYEENETMINLLDLKLVKKSLIKFEERTLNILYEKEYISTRLYIELNEKIDFKIKRDINNLL